MSSYLLVYNRRTGELQHEVYSGVDGRARALHRRLEIERSRPSSDIEVVVLAADSLDRIRQTHGRYFASSSGLIREAMNNGQGQVEVEV
jgi:hypothetical protein